MMNTNWVKCIKLSPVHSSLRRWKRANYHISRSMATSWITQYKERTLPERYDLIQRIIVPSMSNKHSQEEDGIFPVSVTRLLRDLSRHKGSISTSMQLRDDLSSLLKSKDLSSLVPLLFNDVNEKNPEFVEEEKSVKNHLIYVDKVMQSYLQTSLLCYDSMELRRIEFETSSGILLERVARGESVHRVRSLHELKRRLHDGKRCFGLFHPALQNDPLVFIHVALTTELSASLSSLNSGKSEESPTHAIFYSVNSPHTGLRGLDLASLLIKEVANHLKQTFSSIHTFSTLSPMPKFMSWLQDKSKGKSVIVIPSQHKQRIIDSLLIYKKLIQENDFYCKVDVNDNVQLLQILLTILNHSRLQWMQEESLSNSLKPVMLWLGAYYISAEKVNTKSHVLPLDDVARFHLRNGAIFHSINWMANPSLNGIQTASTMMVNYLYDLEKAEKNAELFSSKSWQLPTGPMVKDIMNIDH